LVDAGRTVGVVGRRVRLLQLAWTAVFLVNLPLPVLFGLSATENDGRAGMFVATLLLLILGFWVCATSGRAGRVLIVGGVLVGLSQFIPALQFAAGMASLGLGQALGQVKPHYGGEPGNVISEAGGFLVTLSTGDLLMTASVALGLLLQAITPRRWWGGDSGIGTTSVTGRGRSK